MVAARWHADNGTVSDSAYIVLLLLLTVLAAILSDLLSAVVLVVMVVVPSTVRRTAVSVGRHVCMPVHVISGALLG